MELILWMLLAHYILDYPLQGDFLAQTKGKYKYSLFVHSFIYGFGMALAFMLMGVDMYMAKGFLIMMAHIVIDYRKANAKDKDLALTTYLYIDQAMHIMINLMFLWM